MTSIRYFLHAGGVLALFLVALHPLEAQAGCDLEVTRTEPVGKRMVGGKTIDWKVEYRNVGDEPCKKNAVVLRRTAGRGGSTTTIGGTRGRQRLNALAGSSDVLIQIDETDTPSSGTWIYLLKFVSPHSDADNQNHMLMKTLLYPGAGGGHFGALNALFGTLRFDVHLENENHGQ